MSSEPEITIERVSKVSKDIVEDALASGTLNNWTKRLLRAEIAKRLHVEVAAISSSTELKNAIKEAIDEAQTEYQEAHPSSELPVPKDDAAFERTRKNKKVDKSPKPKKRKSEPLPDTPPPKKKKTTQTRKYRSSSIVLSDDEDAPKAGPSSSKKMDPKVPKSTSMLIDLDNKDEKKDAKKSKEDESDTELEDLIDEEPTKTKQKNKGVKKAEKDTSAKQRSRKKKEPEEEDKDDKEIKRLKSFITASGFRKQYNKLFSTLPDPSNKRSQIKMLKDILMEECRFPNDGKRWSLKLAKELKEKREFEKELEDVKAFEKAVSSRSTGGSKSAVPRGSSVTDAMDEDEEEFQPRKNAARKSIMAFLGDQSDSE